ncbi:MAG: hypothetical protein KGZ79_00350 [Dethiobacter sp.]|jgi:hypothetical protein|nr:hypothetical protein [Dethiobacter sp.]
MPRKTLLNLLRDECGEASLTSQVFLVLGVGTIIFALLVIFREQLIDIVNETFTNFRGGQTW